MRSLWALQGRAKFGGIGASRRGEYWCQRERIVIELMCGSVSMRVRSGQELVLVEERRPRCVYVHVRSVPVQVKGGAYRALSSVRVLYETMRGKIALV